MLLVGLYVCLNGVSLASTEEGLYIPPQARVINEQPRATSPKITQSDEAARPKAAAQRMSPGAADLRNEARAVKLGQRMVWLLSPLNRAIKRKTVSDQQAEVFKSIINYTLAGHTKIEAAIRQSGYQGEIVPSALSAENRRLLREMAMGNVLRYGVDLAPRFGLEVEDDSLEYRFKMTDAVLQELEKLLGIQ